MSESLRRHLESPLVSTRAYLERLTGELGQGIAARRKVYLDTCYWVFIRDASLGRAKRSEHDRILLDLRDAVSSGKAVCPVSDVAFMELSTQSDDITRLATAQLLDELSGGVALQSEPYRIRSELKHLINHPFAEDAPQSMRDIAWVWPSFVFGPVVPTSSHIPPDLNLAFQKSAIDALIPTTFRELAKDSAAALSLKQSFDASADRMNIEMRLPENTARSFDQAVVAEVAGLLSLFEVEIGEILAERFARDGHDIETLSKSQLKPGWQAMSQGLVNGFRFARKTMALRLPSIYLHAIGHASIRMDRTRKVNGSFLRDLHHGCAGVGYHDAVFTEKPLKVLLRAGNIAAHETFNCAILSDESEVLAYLQALLSD